MPTYGYQCLTCKEQFETVQRITEDALKIHDGCGGALRRLLYPVGIVFKGSGFHVNDYARAGAKEPTESASAKEGSGEKKGDDKAETKAEARTETKTETNGESKTETKTEAKSETAPAPAASTES